MATIRVDGRGVPKLVVDKPISRCVYLACGSLLTKSLLQVLDTVVAS